MPFFPHQAYLSTQPTLLDILSAIDEPTKAQPCARVVRRAPQTQTFTPRFDVAETGEAYELFGELPGLEQEDLSIEFSDAQTLVVKGRVERVTKPRPVDQVATEQSTAAGEADNVNENEDTASEKSLNATVEDEYDEADAPLTPSTVPSTATVPAAEEQQEKKVTEEKATEEQKKPKYWITERRTGSFARSFSFEQRIEPDNVRASLRNGVLYVVVPKSLRSRRVVVSVA